jgi:hypothetical protein
MVFEHICECIEDSVSGFSQVFYLCFFHHQITICNIYQHIAHVLSCLEQLVQ